MSTVDVGDRLSNVTIQTVITAVLAFLGLLLVLDLALQFGTGEITVGEFGSYVWNGITDSLYIALAAIGLSMTYSILRFANFAHGDLMTTGAFTGWTVAYLIGGAGTADLSSRLLLRADGGATAGSVGMDVLSSPLAIVLGLLFAAALTILIALATDRLVYSRMRDADGITLLIASIGVALVLRYLLALFYTQRGRGVVAPSPEWMGINLHEMTLVVSALVLIAGVHVLLQYTKLGKSMRAMSDNRDLALITGIPTERVIRATWIIGAGLAGVSGYLIVLDQEVISINLGWYLLLLIFAAVILGGIGSIYGALAGSLVIGLTVNLSLIWLPSGFINVAAFGLMILALIYKPDGLLGGVRTA